MATVDAAAVKKLREMTGAGILDCKKALTENNGDFEQAQAWLREKLGVKGGTRDGRSTSEGAIGVAISEDGKRAAIVEVNCETDFVGRNETFRELVSAIAQTALNSGASDVEGLLADSFGNGKTVDQQIKESIGTIGESIVLKRVQKLETSGVVGSYVHSDGKQAALVEVQGEGNAETLQTIARDVAMQAVALRPQYVNRDAVPQDVLESEKRIYEQQAAQEGKPEAIQAKIAEGRLNKEFFQAVSLLDQPFIREQKQTVAQYVKATAPGATVTRFVRFKVGEA